MIDRFEQMRRERAALASEVLRLRAQGLTHKQVGARLGISWKKSAVLANDPDGSRLRERHERAGGVCADCGGRTSAGSGRDPAKPERCWPCERERLHAARKWTPEVVVDAIRRFAADHGRPPIADEWITADPYNGYPPRSAVYRSTRHSDYGAFPSWADAIEAAGFERPTTGRRTRTMPTQVRNGYVVLHERDDGLWEVIGTQQEHSQVLALNAALNGHNPDEGRWTAVPARYWEPRALRPKTVYEFVTEPSPASGGRQDK